MGCRCQTRQTKANTSGQGTARLTRTKLPPHVRLNFREGQELGRFVPSHDLNAKPWSYKRLRFSLDESVNLNRMSDNTGVACGVRTQAKRLNVSAQNTQPLKL